MEPTTAKTFKKGQAVIIMDKQDLIDRLGADEFGNPKTTVKFNQDGLMDHYYGQKAKVTDVNDVFISVEILDQIPGKEYSWGVSSDMLALDDGFYVSTGGASVEPLRAFMPRTKTPTVKSVWRSLNALKKKEALSDGVIADLLVKYTQLDFDKFRLMINHAPKFKAINGVANAATMLSYYPEMDIEELAVLCGIIKDSSDGAKEVKKTLLEVARNTPFKAEFGNTPYTPFKRLRQEVKVGHIDKIWGNLKFNDALVKNTKITSESMLHTHIHSVVIAYMDKHNLHTLTDQIIEVK